MLWEKLPSNMQIAEVKRYYTILGKKKLSLALKRIFDVAAALSLIIILAPVFAVIYLIIRLESPGPAIFRQERVTMGGKIFKVFKFRTMISGADKFGAAVTIAGDPRITKCGKLLRKTRLDEIPQLFNILSGDLTFVGIRPEVPKYVEKYTSEMMATLLIPAGVTSPTSILFKDEDKLLEGSSSPDETYVKEILPRKMVYNLKYLENLGFWYDLKIMIKTLLAVIKN